MGSRAVPHSPVESVPEYCIARTLAHSQSAPCRASSAVALLLRIKTVDLISLWLYRIAAISVSGCRALHCRRSRFRETNPTAWQQAKHRNAAGNAAPAARSPASHSPVSESERADRANGGEHAGRVRLNARQKGVVQRAPAPRLSCTSIIMANAAPRLNRQRV